MTKKEIQRNSAIVQEIVRLWDEESLSIHDELTIFYNGKKLVWATKEETEADVTLIDQYADANSVTLITEGSLSYEMFNYGAFQHTLSKFEEIARKHGMHWELDYTWSVALRS